MHRRDSGFTLVEIIVVLGVIAVLAAILFPVLAGAKEGGRQTACLSNLKQLGKGMGLLRTSGMGNNQGQSPVLYSEARLQSRNRCKSRQTP